MNVARAFLWGYDPQKVKGDHDSRTMINIVGSFSTYDWCYANVERVNHMMKEAVYPATSPVGIRDRVRVDNFIVVDDTPLEQQPFSTQGSVYYDGGFPWTSHILMDIDSGLNHEIGHTTLGLPDIYGYPHRTINVFTKDANGQRYGGTSLYPEVWAERNDAFEAPFTFAYYDHPDRLGVGYLPLMVECHQWLESFSAEFCHRYRQQRKGLADGIDQHPGLYIPTNNALQVYDINDQPLKGAAIYVYPVVQTWVANGYAKYVPDRAKYIGSTDDNGYYLFPKYSDQSWDDPDSDTVEGSHYYWNPFKHLYSEAWSSSWTNGECLVLKIVSGDKEEFQWLSLNEVNVKYMEGETSLGSYPVRTSLTSLVGGTPIVRPTIPDALKITNRKPVPIVPSEITVGFNETYTIDGSSSYDPEGQPLYYRWHGDYVGLSQDPTITATAPGYETDIQYQFYVYDGLRISDQVTITVKVREGNPPPPPPTTEVTGLVTDSGGVTIAGAIVGMKKSGLATADADFYAVTDTAGKYSFTLPAAGVYYLAAWKSGWLPSPDKLITIKSGTGVTQNLQLTQSSGINIIKRSPTVAMDSPNYIADPYRAVNGDTNSLGWNVKATAGSPVYYYIDLRKPVDISDIVIHRMPLNDSAGNKGHEDLQIDVMYQGDPLIGTSWENNSSVSTVYRAWQSTFGCAIDVSLTQKICINAIPLAVAGVRGIRLKLDNTNLPSYNLTEVQVHHTGSQKLAFVSGNVRTLSGTMVSSTIGVKTSPKAVADSMGYTPCISGYRFSAYPGETLYVAAWADTRYRPTEDQKITVPEGGLALPDFQLKNALYKMQIAGVAASSSATSNPPGLATDWNSTTGWISADSSSEPQYYYVDLGNPVDIGDILLTTYQQNSATTSTCDDYQIDVMKEGDPLDPSSWVGNSAVKTLYSAIKTLHGAPRYAVPFNSKSDTSLNALRLSSSEGADVVGIRIKFSNSRLSPKSYGLREIAVYPLVAPIEVESLSAAKNKIDGTELTVRGDKLTYTPGGLIPGQVCYLESTDRSCGIRLNLPASPTWNISTGDTVDITGTLAASNDEVSIWVSDLMVASHGEPLKPLLMNTSSLGGGNLGVQNAVWSWVKRENFSGSYVDTLVRVSGLNNIGVLVKICGRVTQIDQNGTYFYLDDGARLKDGTKTGITHNVGVRVAADGRNYAYGQWLTITGISGCYKEADGRLRRVFRPINIAQ